jgi:hypothetical protein
MFRIKLFVWRLAHNSGLQVKLNIARRGLDLNTPCPICSRFDEDTGHLCFKCKEARHGWQLLNMEDRRIML